MSSHEPPTAHIWRSVPRGAPVPDATADLTPFQFSPVPQHAELSTVDSAYERGVREGSAAATAAYEAELAAQSRRTADAVDAAGHAADRAASAAKIMLDAAAQLNRREDDLVSVVESDLVAAALELTEVLLGRELATLDAPALLALARAAELVPERGDLVLRVHPGDVGAVRLSIDSPPEELLPLLEHRTVSVTADPAVEMSGCVIECGPARVDAQWSAALRRMRATLER